MEEPLVDLPEVGEMYAQGRTLAVRISDEDVFLPQLRGDPEDYIYYIRIYGSDGRVRRAKKTNRHIHRIFD